MRLRLLVGFIGLLMSAQMAAAAPFAYIANSGDSSVSVVDVGSNTVTDRIALDNLSFPYGVAINPSGTLVYVSCQVKKSVEVIDAVSKTVVTGVMPTITYVPSGLAVNPAESRLYAADQTNGSVHVYDLTVSPYVEIGTGIPVGSGTGSFPEGLALSPDGTKLYVANSGSASVSVIATASNTKTADIATAGVEPKGLMVSPDGARVYVASTSGSKVGLITLPSTVTLIDVGTTSNNIAMVSTGTPTNVFTNLLGTNTLGVINYATSTVTTPANNGQLSPWGVSINPAGTKLIVTNNQSDSISIFNPASLATAPTVVALPAGARPTTLGNFIGPEMVTITASVSAGGTISPLGPVNVAVGKSKKFDVTPDATHRILEVDVDAVPQIPVPISYTFNNVQAAHAITASFQKIFPITVLTQGTGSGTFAWSAPNAPISGSCVGGTVCKTYDLNADVSITATANPGSTFVSWDPAYCSSISGANGEICNINALTTARFALPTFSGVSQMDVRCKETMAPYAKISDAYVAVGNNQTIQATINAASENLVLNRAVSFTLQGGFDTLYGGNPGLTTISSLTVSSGTVIIERIQIH